MKYDPAALYNESDYQITKDGVIVVPTAPWFGFHNVENPSCKLE